jgi:cell division protein FtsA
MRKNFPVIFVEINHLNFTFVAGVYDNNQNLKIVEKNLIPNEGMGKNKFTDINIAQEIIKKNIQLIESKLDYIFKEVIVILDFFNYSCLNLSGFKKLNGSQVLEENISYVLNSLKLNVTENEKENTILHIFNSKNILDGTTVENLPIGLFGNFYSHELTFFLINNNDLKNIKQIFNKIDLKIKKILLKSFVEGAYLTNKDINKDSFFKIKMSKARSQLSIFEKSSFRYVEHFDFGTDIILKDIAKVCSIDSDFINKILLDRFLESKDFKVDELLEKKYFIRTNYRKIKKKLIADIAKARIQEIANIILKKNINLNLYKKDIKKIYIIIEEDLIFDNFKENFKQYFSQNLDSETQLINTFEIDSLIISAANLSNYGWKKEAIPVTQTKNTLISKIFKALFS